MSFGLDDEIGRETKKFPRGGVEEELDIFGRGRRTNRRGGGTRGREDAVD